MPLRHDYVPIMVTLHSVKYIGIVAKWICTYKCYMVLGYMYESSGRAAQPMCLSHYYGSITGCTRQAHIPSCAHHTILNIFEMWMNGIHCPGLHEQKLFESGLANALAAQLHKY